MKANVKTITADTIVVRGIPLKFNGFNERDLRRWQEVGNEVETKYPGAMDLETDPNKIGGFSDIADKYEKGTAAFCELFDGVFGEGTSAKLFGDDPYYGLCLEVYYEFLGGVERQVEMHGKNIVKNVVKYVPTGPKGGKK